MEGWIKIYRKITDWQWFDVPEMVALWVHLLINANLEEREWRGVTIPRGSLVTSRKALAEESGLSEQQVRTCLSRLISTNEITIESTNKFTIITITNFDSYQPRKEDNQPAQQPTTQPTINQQSTTTKEYKNNNITLPNAPAREETATDSWRFISSARRWFFGGDADRIAEYKRQMFAKEVEECAVEVGMPAQQQDAFIRWWTEHTPGNENIRADYEAVFNTADRMRVWMDRNAPKAGSAAPKPQKSRMDQMEDNLKFINAFFDGKQSNTAAADDQ